MRSPIILALLLVIGASPALARGGDALDREIEKLQGELGTLEAQLKTAIETRAKYRSQRAQIAYWIFLLKQDEFQFSRYQNQANHPVTFLDLFLSSERSTLQQATLQRVYSPGKTFLWFKARFGLTMVQEKKLFTIRIDLVDSQDGSRIYQSFGPFQRRVSRVLEDFFLPIEKLTVAAGSYQLRATIEVGSTSDKRTVPYRYTGQPTPVALPPAPTSADRPIPRR
jgi:hypothetical protein